MDKLGKCCDADHERRGTAGFNFTPFWEVPEPKLDEDPRLAGVKHCLTPTALFEAAVPEPHSGAKRPEPAAIGFHDDAPPRRRWQLWQDHELAARRRAPGANLYVVL
jgi:hypothetical protein